MNSSVNGWSGAGLLVVLAVLVPGLDRLEGDLRGHLRALPGRRANRERSGAANEARVLLLPESERGTGVLRSSFPWEQLEPIRMPVRGIAMVEGLPPGRVRAIVLSASGKGDKRFTLEPGETREVVVDMRAVPVLEGSVVANGAPVAGARVVLTSRPVKTAAIALGDASRILYTQPIPDLPFARRETKTDANGTFELPWWSTGTSGSAPQHLYVLAANGTILHQREVETRTPTLVAEW